MEKIISSKNVYKSFGSVKALSDFTLDVKKGEFYGLLGPNGAGKTTALRILTGQIEGDLGIVSVSGIDPGKNPIELRRLIGIVPDEEALPSFLTVKEYMGLVEKVYKLPEGAGKKWLSVFRLEDKVNELCGNLSRGEKHKAMLSGALVHEPEILFLDEPLSGLDPISQVSAVKTLKEYQKNGGTVFMCTHLLDFAEKLCTRAQIIERGKKGPDMKNPTRSKMEAAFRRLGE